VNRNPNSVKLFILRIVHLGVAAAIAGAPCSADPIRDTPFIQEYHEEYPLDSRAASDVRALAFDKTGRLWAATSAGVRCLDAESQHWNSPNGADIGPTYAICCDNSGKIWIGAWNGLYSVENGKVLSTQLSGSPVGALRTFRQAKNTVEYIYAAGPAGIWRKNASSDGDFTKLNGSWQTAIRSVLPADDDHLWIGTSSGLYLQKVDGVANDSVRFSRPSVVQSSNINALALLPDAEMVIASTGGLDFYRGTSRIRKLTSKDGMPYRNALSLTVDGSGRIWAATHLGVERYENGKWTLRHSRRWLLSDDTRDVAIGPDGTAWVATAAGVDAIRSKHLSLKAKAEYFLQQLRARHLREPGLVGPAVLVTPGDLSKSFIEDDDNDGEHTGMYLAMESMRFAVTRDPSARANAKVAFHALMALQRVTGTNYFIARSMLPLDPPIAPRHEVDRMFTPQEIAETARTDPREKIIEKRWVPSADGKWLWKRDASSDEVDGHMFGYCTYYDLAADEDEERLVADEVDRVIGGIVDHGFVLQDIDGKATRWGNWSPQSLNHDPNWHEERAGNCVEMMEYLGVAYHVTGKQKYLEAARTLIDKYGYDKNMTQTVFDTPAERTHIEDELMSIVYPNLFSHLILPGLKSAALTSIQRWHKGCERDGIPFYDFVYNEFSGRNVPLSRAVDTLREWPLSHIEWTVDNSKREDVQRDLTPGMEDGFLTHILPRSEMGLCMWDQEPYKAVIGNGGQREDRQNDWLLAYWMGRYYGLLAE